jgi:putative hydrolase of the HAD superfamily
MTQISTLFWDNGGVILTNGWDRGARKRAVEKFQLDWADFEDRHELMLDAFEKGSITLDEYLRRTVFYRDRPYSVDDFKQFMFNESQAMPESLDFVRQLAGKKRYQMFALNNESTEINEYRIRQFKLPEIFEVFFSSCYLALRKPGAEIYTKALKITQREAGECILIDDRGLNLECARELGMNTILFRNTAQLREDLNRFGVSAG